MEARTAVILLIGSDDSLLRTRRWLFESRGFPTLTLNRLEDIEKIADQVKISVALLCHSLDDRTCARASEAIRVRWPEAKCLALCSPVGQGSSHFVHDTPLSLQDPSALLSAVTSILAA